MKRFEVSFEYTASYNNVVHAKSMTEAFYKVMKEVDLPHTHIEPREGSVFIRERPEPLGSPGNH